MLTLGIGFCYAGAIASVLLAHAHPIIKLVLVSLCLLHVGWVFSARTFLRGHCAIVSLFPPDSRGLWRVCTLGGEVYEATLLGSSWMSDCLLVLNFHFDSVSRWASDCVLIPKDALPNEDAFWRMHRWCRLSLLLNDRSIREKK